MKIRARHIALTLTAIVAVLFALPLMVYVPPVQRWLVAKATAVASEATGMDISIGDVSLRFPLTLSLGDVKVTRSCTEAARVSPCRDTIALIGRVDADVALLPLFRLRAELSALTVSDARLNTFDLISDTQVSGTVGKLAAGPASANIKLGTVDIKSLQLADADLCVILSDTAAVDTTASEPLPWHIALDEAIINNTRCEVHTPGDSIILSTTIGQATATDADIDLLRERYALTSLRIGQSAFFYKSTSSTSSPPSTSPLLDYDNLSLSNLSLSIDSIVYCDPSLSLLVRHASMKERCGLQLDNLTATVALDSLGIRIPSLSLRTPSSSLYAQASIDYASLDSLSSITSSPSSTLTLDANLSRHDLSHFYPLKNLPDWPLTVKGTLSGNVAAVNIGQLTIDLPTVLHAEANGTVALSSHSSPLTSNLSSLTSHLSLHNPSALLTAFDIPQSGWRLPRGLRFDGTLDSDGRQYTADVAVRDGNALMKGKVLLNADTDAYTADLNIVGLDVTRFVPDVPATVDRATVTARGRGFDPYDKKTFLEATAIVDSMAYQQWAADSLHVTATLDEGNVVAKVALGRLNAQLTTDKGSLGLGMAGTATVQSNIRDSHKLSALMTDIVITDSAGVHHPENLGVLLAARPDTTYARVQNGNFIVKMDASGSYDRLLTKLTALADTMSHQMENRIIDQQLLKSMLPDMRLYVTCGRENLPANFLRASQDIDFKDFLAEVTLSAATGINGHIDMDMLSFGTTLLDTIRVTLKDSERGLTYQTRVANGKKNPLRFLALLDGHIYEHGIRAGLRVFDKDGRQGLRIGTQAYMESDGIRFTLLPKDPTIAFRIFTVNDDNFLFLRNDLRLSAALEMEDDDGTVIDVYSEDTDSTRLQDLTVSTAKLNLKHLTDIAPFLPRIEGLLDGDFHIIMDDKRQISVAADINVDNLVYEGSSMGNIDTEFVYLQNNDNTHSVDGILLRNGQQVASFDGKYINKKVSNGNEHLDGTLNLVNTPLNMVNGFITDHIAGLEGYANGKVTMAGPLGNLIMDGSVRLDSAILYSQPYGIRMAVDNTPIRIDHSKLTLNNFKLYSVSSSTSYTYSSSDTLSITGTADFSHNGPTSLDFRIRANELQLINSKQQPGSLLFGQGFISLTAMVRGTTEKTSVRGRLNVLGKTDITYLLLDSPLSTDNQMDELVKFTDFNDSTETAVVNRPLPGGLDVNLNVSIDQGAHVRCGLNADQSNYVDIFGGGDLRLRMSDTEEMQLTGRYTIASGTMKYSLPVIPLKTFTIQDGSYVEFTGSMDNPTLNITATERTRATVGQDGGPSRSVAFDCGVVVTKTLSDMGLQFIISSPEDVTVQSELQSMTMEQRAKLAVTMLTTGMYLADGNTAGFSMNSALSSFLQSEINNIAGNALSTLDISMGVDNTTDASGRMHTDYSFQFAKRFWNNRLKVEIGGKVSSGQDAQQGQKQSFFDNVSMEYRLSPTSNQYLKLFYKQNVYDWLDGYTGEYGGGYIYKRKLDHWWDMFRLWKTEEKLR